MSCTFMFILGGPGFVCGRQVHVMYLPTTRDPVTPSFPPYPWRGVQGACMSFVYAGGGYCYDPALNFLLGGGLILRGAPLLRFFNHPVMQPPSLA